MPFAFSLSFLPRLPRCHGRSRPYINFQQGQRAGVCGPAELGPSQPKEAHACRACSVPRSCACRTDAFRISWCLEPCAAHGVLLCHKSIHAGRKQARSPEDLDVLGRPSSSVRSALSAACFCFPDSGAAEQRHSSRSGTRRTYAAISVGPVLTTGARSARIASTRLCSVHRIRLWLGPCPKAHVFGVPWKLVLYSSLVLHSMCSWRLPSFSLAGTAPVLDDAIPAP